MLACALGRPVRCRTHDTAKIHFVASISMHQRPVGCNAARCCTRRLGSYLFVTRLYPLCLPLAPHAPHTRLLRPLPVLQARAARQFRWSQRRCSTRAIDSFPAAVTHQRLGYFDIRHGRPGPDPKRAEAPFTGRICLDFRRETIATERLAGQGASSLKTTSVFELGGVLMAFVRAAPGWRSRSRARLSSAGASGRKGG